MIKSLFFSTASCNTFSVKSFVKMIFFIGLKQREKKNQLKLLLISNHLKKKTIFTLGLPVRSIIQHYPISQQISPVQKYLIFQRLS